jgi:hypothetical protein
MATHWGCGKKRKSFIDRPFHPVRALLAVDGNVEPDLKDIGFRGKALEHNPSSFWRTLSMPAVFHRLNFTAGFSAVS